MADDENDVVEEDGGVELPNRTPLIQVYATAGEWITHDPILQDGQLGIEYDPATKSAKLKAGWGGSRWTELPYLTGISVSLASNVDGNQTLETIPAPREPGMTMVSIGLNSLMWMNPDPGEYIKPTFYSPRILRQPKGRGFGPPRVLPDGQLAVNINGDLSSDQRPSLYVGDANNEPIRLLSENDLLINLKPRAIGASGGANVADAINAAQEPIQLAESELAVVSHDGSVYLFGGLPGRYGGVGFSGPGGPGRYVALTDFILVSINPVAASTEEIVNGSAPGKSVNAGTQLLSALRTLLNTDAGSKIVTHETQTYETNAVVISDAAVVEAMSGQGTTAKGLILDAGRF